MAGKGMEDMAVGLLPYKCRPRHTPAQEVTRRILGRAWWARFTLNAITRTGMGIVSTSRATFRTSTIDTASVTEADHQHHKLIILNLADDPVVADAKAPQTCIGPCKGFASLSRV